MPERPIMFAATRLARIFGVTHATASRWLDRGVIAADGVDRWGRKAASPRAVAAFADGPLDVTIPPLRKAIFRTYAAHRHVFESGAGRCTMAHWVNSRLEVKYSPNEVREALVDLVDCGYFTLRKSVSGHTIFHRPPRPPAPGSKAKGPMPEPEPEPEAPEPEAPEPEAVGIKVPGPQEVYLVSGFTGAQTWPVKAFPTWVEAMGLRAEANHWCETVGVSRDCYRDPSRRFVIDPDGLAISSPHDPGVRVAEDGLAYEVSAVPFAG